MFRLTDKVVFLTGCGSVGNSSSHRGSIRSMASRTSCSVISGAMPRAARQVPTSISGLRSSARIWPVRKNQGSGELVIDPQQISSIVAFNLGAKRHDFGFHPLHQFWVHAAQGLIDLKIGVIPIRRKADQGIGAHQPAKAAVIDCPSSNHLRPIGALEAEIAAFVERYNYRRHHESLNNLTPADVYFGRGKTILLERERIKRRTIQHRRLMHHPKAA